MASTNETHLSSLISLAQSRFSDLIKKIEASGYQVIITSSLRSAEKQKQLFEKLKSQKNGRAAKKSKHQEGIAIDINLKKDGKLWKKSTPKSEWEATGVPKLAEDNGFRWGGYFKKNYDPVHFDLGNDFTSNTLAAEMKTPSNISSESAFYYKFKSFYMQYAKGWIE